MEANANLVGQLQDMRTRLARAEAQAKDAENKLAENVTAPPSRVAPAKDEWARMAHEGVVRVRMPCAQWNANGRFTMLHVGMGRGQGVVERSGRSRRAEAAGLTTEEQETLEEVYPRAHSRTWASIRSTCERNDGFRDAMAEADSDMDDQGRIALCRAQVLGAGEETTRRAMLRVAELRAAGASIDRASGDEERVFFALTLASSVLFDEMTKSLGRDKAKNAVELGASCTDETVFDLRTAPSEG